MSERISRRDYLNSALLASGSTLLGGACPLDLLGREDWDGYGGVGDYSGSNGNTFEVMTEAHKICDHAFEPLPADVEDTAERFDCVVVGGGTSGLAAALFFKRQADPRRTCLVLENHAIFGGEVRRNEFMVDGQRLIAHQGSAMFFPPLPNTFLADFYRSIGIDTWQFPYQTWSGKEAEIPLGQTSYTEGGKNSGFYYGARFGKSPLFRASKDGYFRSGLPNRITRFSGGAHVEDPVFLTRSADRRAGEPRPYGAPVHPFREYERRIREQFAMMFSSSGFDVKRGIAAIILNRWGHAYLSAQPGFFFGKDGKLAPGEVLRSTPFGRIAFANSDLTGIMDHRASILEAHRAVGQAIDRVATT